MKKECVKCVWIVCSVIILIIACFVVYNYSKTVGMVSWPVDANRQFKASSFSCANGANSQLESKNCRSAAFWNNFATKFCRDLCEMNPDLSIDNDANIDPACALASLRLFKECEGNVVQPVGAGSVEVGGDCTQDSECVAGAYCEGAPYGVCAEVQTTTGMTTFPITTGILCDSTRDGWRQCVVGNLDNKHKRERLICSKPAGAIGYDWHSDTPCNWYEYCDDAGAAPSASTGVCQKYSFADDKNSPNPYWQGDKLDYTSDIGVEICSHTGTLIGLDILEGTAGTIWEVGTQ